MDRKYEYGVGAIRFLSMCCIVLCHIFQHYEYRVAFYLNIGVPVFLVISGYLFGQRKIVEISRFYKSRLLRILIPYYLMLIATIAANVVKGVPFTGKDLLSMLLCQQWYAYTIPNCGHLWYISCIIGCYLITPILQSICAWLQSAHKNAYWISLVLIVLALQLIQIAGGLIKGAHFYAAYLFGYFFAYANKTSVQQLKPWVINLTFGVGLAGFVGMFALEQLVMQIPGIAFEYYKIGLAAISCLFFINNSKWFNNWCWKVLISFGDKYSYEVYLAHHIFILGTLSVLGLTQNVTLDVLIAVALICVCAVALEGVSTITHKLIDTGRQRKL